MPVTAVDFVARFPEYTGAPTPLVERCIAEAERRTSAAVWGDLEDDGVRYLAAHLLACSPNAKDMRIKSDPTGSIYLTERRRLERIVASGFRVTGRTG